MNNIMILGMPNVGKSTLFNLLVKNRSAITSDIAGTTRDTKKQRAYINNAPLNIIDTGGLDSSNELFEQISKKTLKEASEANILLYMVDGTAYPSDKEREHFLELQKLNPKIALVLNKIDDQEHYQIKWEYYSFGAKKIFKISALKKNNINQLKEWVYQNLSRGDKEHKSNPKKGIKVSIIGRPNVGKSSLLNAILKEQVAIVSPIFGTTTDPVDKSINYENKTITFIDTAGIRKKNKVNLMEKYALFRTVEMIKKSDISILVIDSSDDIKSFDKKACALITKYNKGSIIVLNKQDIRKKEYEERLKDIKREFWNLSYSPIISVSAISKKRVDKVPKLILDVYKNYNQNIDASMLNKLINEASNTYPIMYKKQKQAKVYSVKQTNTKPVEITIKMSIKADLTDEYKRYLKNFLRRKIELKGSPIIINTK